MVAESIYESNKKQNRIQNHDDLNQLTDEEIKREHRIGYLLVTLLTLFLVALFLAYFNTTQNLLQCIGKKGADKCQIDNPTSSEIDEIETVHEFNYLANCQVKIDSDSYKYAAEQSHPFTITDMNFLCQLK